MRTQQNLLGVVGTAVLAAVFLTAPSPVAAADTNAMAPAAPWQANGVSEVVKLFKGGISSDIIVNYIGNSPLSFYLSADNIISLQQQGVPENIVQAMIKRNGELGRMAPQQVAAAPGAPAIPAQAPPPAYYSYSGDPSFDAALAARQVTSYNNYALSPPVYSAPAYDYDYYDSYYPWGWDGYYPGVVVGGGFGFGRGFGGFDRGFRGGFGGGGGFRGGGGGFGGHGGGGHR